MAELTAEFLLQLLEPGHSHSAAARLHDANSTPSLDTAWMVQKIREGLPVQSFAILLAAIRIPAERLAGLIQIPTRTLARRKVFKTDESERILRLGRLYQLALDLFGDPEEARGWLLRPLKGLGNVAPLDFADTEPGAREIENLLGRLAHGVFS